MALDNPSDSLVDDATGIGGNEYYPMADDDDAAGEDLLPGARALTEAYEHFMDLAEVLSDLNKKQEQPKVQKLLDQFAATCEDHCRELLRHWHKVYPDLPPPGPEPDEFDRSDLDEGNRSEDNASDLLTDAMTKEFDGMNGVSGSEGGYLSEGNNFDFGSGDEDEDGKEAIMTKRKARRFKKRLELSRAWRALLRTKRLSKNHSALISKAADFLEEAAEHEGEWSHTHKSAALYHAKAMRGICKDYATAASGTAADLQRSGIGVPEGGAMTKSLNSAERQELEAFRKRLPELEKQLAQLTRAKRMAQQGR